MISNDVIKRFLGRLGTMPYFPAHEAERDAVIEVVLQFAETDEQIDWLGQRFIGLFPEWPGTWELRAVFCSRFKPKDGRSITSRAFGDEGIEKEQAEQRKRIEAAPLPAGHLITADPALEERIRNLAKTKPIRPLAVRQKREKPDV
jgi:hypothetical protein